MTPKLQASPLRCSPRTTRCTWATPSTDAPGDAVRIEKNGQAIVSMDDWRRLAPPKHPGHWVPGRSALELARAWCGAAGPAMPAGLRELLDSRPETRNLRVDVVHPEHRIVFDEHGGEPRNADLAFVGEGPTGRVAVTVEAKADEPFGPTVGEAMAAALERAVGNPRSRGTERILGLVRALFNPAEKGQPFLTELQYQLLTGLAGTLAYAAESGARTAAFVVHEFITSKTRDERHAKNARDLESFLRRLGLLRPGDTQYTGFLGPVRVPASKHVPRSVDVLVGKVVTDVRSQ